MGIYKSLIRVCYIMGYFIIVFLCIVFTKNNKLLVSYMYWLYFVLRISVLLFHYFNLLAVLILIRVQLINIQIV